MTGRPEVCPACGDNYGKVVFTVYHPNDMELPGGQSLPNGCIVEVANGYEIYSH